MLRRKKGMKRNVYLFKSINPQEYRKRKEKDYKRDNQIKHAKRRFKERYDIGLSDHLYSMVVDQIRSGKAKFIERQSKRVTKWDVCIEGKDVRVVYDKKRGTVVTALHKGWEGLG